MNIAILVGEVGGVNGVQDGAIEGLDDGGHGNVVGGQRDVVLMRELLRFEGTVRDERRAVGVVEEDADHGHHGHEQHPPPSTLRPHVGEGGVAVVGSHGEGVTEEWRVTRKKNESRSGRRGAWVCTAEAAEGRRGLVGAALGKKFGRGPAES